jgi:hypothetical protein
VTEILDAMTKPDANGHAHVKRVAPKGLLPSTWIERTLRISYVDAHGTGTETSGVLADLYPFGMVVNNKGAKTALSWDAVRVVELVED